MCVCVCACVCACTCVCLCALSECQVLWSVLLSWAIQSINSFIPCSSLGTPPTLSFTATVVSDTQVSISVMATVNHSPCPADNATRYIVSATNAADSSMVVSKTYSSIPQGEVLSGFYPSTSYHIVVAVQIVSGAIGHSNVRTVTTLPSG